MRTAIYVRVSSEEQAEEGYSIPAQVKALRQFAHQQGWTVVAEYVEEGVSGRTDNRPQFQAMVRAGRQRPRPFDLVLVHKMDRFARNRQHSVVYKALFRKELGIDVRSMTEQFDDTPSGRLHEAIMEALAEFYSENLATEVLKGQRERASTGRSMCVPPIGYLRCQDRSNPDQYGRYIPDPETAPLVQWIFATYADGETGMATIARHLRTDGFARFGAAAARYSWTTGFIGKILANRAYLGELIWGQRDTRRQGKLRPEGDWVVVPGAHEPLVDRATWERCLAIRRGRRNTALPRAGRDYLLRGLLRCLDCGQPMIHYNYQWADRKSGRRVYRPSAICTGYTRHRRCYCNRMPLSAIEQALSAQLRAITRSHLRPEQFTFLPAKSGPGPSTDPADDLKRQLEAVERQHRRAWEAYKAEVISLEAYRQEKQAYERIRSTLTAQLEQARTVTPGPDAEMVRASLAAMIETADDETLPVSSRRRALAAVVDTIWVSRRRDEVEIWFRL